MWEKIKHILDTHFWGAYLLGAGEVYISGWMVLLGLGSLADAPVYRSPQSDSAGVCMILAGAIFCLDGILLFLYRKISYPMLKRTRLFVVAVSILTATAGVLIIMDAHHKGGDSAGWGSLAGLALIVFALIFVCMACFEFWYIRRIASRPYAN
jgi:hypothetical protein